MLVRDTLVMLGENKVEHDGNDLGFLIPLTTLYSYTSFLLFLFSQPSSIQKNRTQWYLYGPSRKQLWCSKLCVVLCSCFTVFSEVSASLVSFIHPPSVLFATSLWKIPLCIPECLSNPVMENWFRLDPGLPLATFFKWILKAATISWLLRNWQCVGKVIYGLLNHNITAVSLISTNPHKLHPPHPLLPSPKTSRKPIQQANRNQETETNSKFVLLSFVSASLEASFVLNE